MIGLDCYLWVPAVPLTFASAFMPNEPWNRSLNKSSQSSKVSENKTVVLEAKINKLKVPIYVGRLFTVEWWLLIMEAVVPPGCQAVVLVQIVQMLVIFFFFSKEFALQWLALAWLRGIFAHCILCLVALWHLGNSQEPKCFLNETVGDFGWLIWHLVSQSDHRTCLLCPLNPKVIRI